MRSFRTTLIRRLTLVALMALATPCAFAAKATSPTWYDANAAGVSPDWHYRVSVALPGTASLNTTAVVNVDFSALLAQMGVSGTLDVNAVRVVRPGGNLAATQEYTPSVYAGATNSTAGRGEVRFLVEDASATYQIYFDITANGSKPALATAAINGNFEKDTAGTLTPFSWASASANAGYDAQVRPSENPSISTDGTVSGNGASPRTVAGTPFTGNNSYLLGARTNNEGASAFPSSFVTKTIVVPSTNPGNLTFRYRIQGWDSNVLGSTTQFDYLAVTLAATGVTTQNLVGPALARSYATRPFTPNYGTNQSANNSSGYGQYNGFDMDNNGTHRGTVGAGTLTTFTRGQEPWITVTVPLTAFAGRTATLRFAFNNTVLYKSWAHIDDLEWSVVSPTLGNPEAYGVAVTAPAVSPGVDAGDMVSVSASVDASPSTAVFVDILDPAGTVVATNVRLFNDGTHGSSAAAPSTWVNDGSDAAYPTYSVPRNAVSSAAWLVRARAADASSSSVGAAGLARRIGGSSLPVSEANFFNVDDHLFTVNGKANLSHLKTVAMYYDPVNGTVNPKAIPGSKVMYEMTVSNPGGGAVDSNSVYIIDPIPTFTKMCVQDYQAAGQGPVQFTNGSVVSGLSYTFSGLASTTDSLSFSSDGGASYNYVPTADAEGCDAAITHVRIAPSGVMASATSTTTPSFSVRFRVAIK